MFRRRIAPVLLAGLLGLTVLPGDIAHAQACLRLEAELNDLQAGGGGGNRARYERAFREQANVLARTEARARNAGCFGGGFLFFRREVDRTCRTLIPKLRDMEDNLVRLDRLRREGGSNTRRIREVQAMMAIRGCGVPGRENLEASLDIDRDRDLFVPRGTFRTLCVRSCDGYYFPISFSTTQDRFAEDSQACSSMCPGAEAKLFYHANPGQGPEEMVGIDGSFYATTPTAFQYRTSLNPSCSCRPAGGYPTLAAANPGSGAADVAATAALPRPRREPGEDPETLANRDGGFATRSGGLGQSLTASTTTTEDGRPVRVVGPGYLAGPEQEGVVLVPVPN